MGEKSLNLPILNKLHKLKECLVSRTSPNVYFMNAHKYRGKGKKFENICMNNKNKTKNNRKQIFVCTAIQQWDKTTTTATTKTKFLLLTLRLGFSTYQFSVMHHFS